MEHNRKEEINVILEQLNKFKFTATELFAINTALQNIELDLVEYKKLKENK